MIHENLVAAVAILTAIDHLETPIDQDIIPMSGLINVSTLGQNYLDYALGTLLLDKCQYSVEPLKLCLHRGFIREEIQLGIDGITEPVFIA